MSSIWLIYWVGLISLASSIADNDDDGSWTDFGGDSAHTGFKIDTVGGSINSPRVLWELQLSDNTDDSAIQPLIYRGKVIQQDRLGNIYIVSEVTGISIKTIKLLSNPDPENDFCRQCLIGPDKSGKDYLFTRCDSFKQPLSVTMFVVDLQSLTLITTVTENKTDGVGFNGDFIRSAANGLVFTTSVTQSSTIVALELPGLNQLFNASFVFPIFGTSVYEGSRVFVSTWGNDLAELDSSTGNVVWGITFEEADKGNIPWFPIVTNGIAIAVSSAACPGVNCAVNLHGIDITTRRAIWKTAGVGTHYEDAKFIASDGRSTFVMRKMANSIVVVRNSDGKLMSVNKCTGNIPLNLYPMVVTSDFVVSSVCDKITMMDKSTGQFLVLNSNAAKIAYHNKLIFATSGTKTTLQALYLNHDASSSAEKLLPAMFMVAAAVFLSQRTI